MAFTLSLDQGTSSSRAIVFEDELTAVASSQFEFTQHYPSSGWVEHDPRDILTTTITAARNAMAKARVTAADIAAIGITNQRETAIIWDRSTGVPLARALVWQDRRTAEFCARLKASGHEEMITAKTGLLLDPYFSASKISYLLDTVPGARARAEAGELAFGTVDSWLIWTLTDGQTHKTDATNASRTMLYNIHNGEWDDELCRLFRIPKAILPQVMNCIDDFGTTSPDFFGGAIAIRGVAGDQQSALIGQGCVEPGMMKSSYGTGCFALLNTGTTAVASRSKLLTTIGYQFDGVPHYALEGSIFIAGAVVQWLRDGLKIIRQASDVGPLSQKSKQDDVIIVPAFTGLGAPYWQPQCRGAVFGITRDTSPQDFALAALRSVAFQTRDLLDAMMADGGICRDQAMIRVDGGMVASAPLLQHIADIAGVVVDRPDFIETTALGAAWLAGAGGGIYPDQHGINVMRKSDRIFTPSIDDTKREADYAAWQAAIRATITAAERG
ncbi:MAG: glycerol kinase GlpK [Alphaproteobacteria bacterium]|nr:glycerol kinase GlpK [Alphaproteobacteria bacterium]